MEKGNKLGNIVMFILFIIVDGVILYFLSSYAHISLQTTITVFAVLIGLYAIYYFNVIGLCLKEIKKYVIKQQQLNEQEQRKEEKKQKQLLKEEKRQQALERQRQKTMMKK